MREAIRRAGLTGRGAAALAGWDHAKLSDLINGKGGVTEVELSRLLGICRTPADEHEHLLRLFREASTSGWLQLHGEKLPVQVRTLVEHEAQATEIIVWSLTLVPGLLQMPDYMRTLMLASPNVPDPKIDEYVMARVARQKIIEGRRQFTFYIHEQALRLPVGSSPVVMSDQLDHLQQMNMRPYITMRVVPTAIGAHPGTSGSFTLMKFSNVEPIVFLDTENSSVFLDDKASFEVYSRILKALDAVALDAAESKELIARIAT
ncbi:transcriptional regulator [Lentzea sp. NBRC 105346]|nr:transcriptional regulator [Lentzea sp. NBRC 105346]